MGVGELNYHPNEIGLKLKKLDQTIKNKFSSSFVSVRKAFLDLDSNKDGYIEQDDILRFFGDEIDQRDLAKLFIQKSPSGKLNCMDFTKWVGESIH